MEENSIENINLLEENTLSNASEYLEDLLSYFLKLQETLLTAFNNSGKLKLQVVPNNKKLFAFITTARAFSISKIAMDITIRGYPFEGLALTRTLAELTECTDYLLRNEEFIDDYLNGKLKIAQVLKKAKNEKKLEGKYNFGQIWGYMSHFSHATPDMVLLPLTPKSPNQVSIELVNNDSDQISDVAKVITSHLLFQYFIFRIFFFTELIIVNELKEQDSELFNPINVRKLGNLFTDKEHHLDEIFSFVMQAYKQ